MANNIVPAVVLFSIAVGLALMGIESKAPLIAAFEIMEEALKRVMKFVVRTHPARYFRDCREHRRHHGYRAIERLAGLYRRRYVGRPVDDLWRAPCADHGADAVRLPGNRPGHKRRAVNGVRNRQFAHRHTDAE